MKRSWLWTFQPLALAVALLAGLLLAMSASSVRAHPAEPVDVPGGIDGSLYEPDGTTPVAYGWIDIHDAEEQPWMGTDTAPDGTFSIANLPPGTYFLIAHPPSDSPYAASLAEVVEVLSGQWSSAVLTLTEVRISGWVQDSESGGRIGGATVVAHDDEWTVERWATTNVTGEYKIGGVQIGVTYALEALPPPGSEYVQLPIPYSAVPITTGVVLEMRVPPTNVVGIIHNPSGTPVPGAGVVVYHDEYWQETSADELGTFLFRGLPTGEFWLHAAPPWGKDGEGLTASEPFTIPIPTLDSLQDVGVITLPHAYKTLTGYVVLEGTTTVVTNALITAHRLDAPGYADTPTVEPSGAFTLSLTGGEWHVAAEPLDPPVPWIFPGPPGWIVFPDDTTPQSEAVTLEVIPTNAEVYGRVVCPGPALCPGGPGDAFWDRILVELRNDDIGNDAGLGADYGFGIPIPDGWYELVVHVDHPEFQGPEPAPVFVGPGQSLDAGDIELLLKDAAIAGRVRDRLGNPVQGVAVAGWQPEGVGWGRAETNASGVYTMPVIGGDWFVEPQPGPERPYAFRGAPSLVSVAPGGTMSGVDFTLVTADARIEGAAVDADTLERIWGLEGWAFCELGPEFFTDAPMGDGAFELKVEGGESYIIGVDLPPHAPYVSGGTGPVAVGVGEAVTIVLPLEPKDAAIEGRLIDGLTGLPPTEPVWAEVFGEDAEGHWVAVDVHPATAEYRLEVISGTWELRTWADLDSGYAAAPTPAIVTVQSGQTVPQDFEVWPVRSTISGQVLKPDGTPVEAYVFAEGDSPFVGHFETSTWSDTSGNFELLVPEGAYVVGAGLPGDELETLGWLNPTPVDIPWVSAGSPVTGLELRFLQLDGVINGTVSFAAGISVTPTHAAYVWGWAESGEWAETEAALITGTSTFTYAMQVVSDTIWHVGAVYEDWDNGVFYESPERLAPVPPSTGQATANLELGGPWMLPQPFIVSFDGTQMQTIVMPDGVELSIPPGSLVVSGTVTLFIFPTQELRPEPGQEIVGAGYEIWAIDQSGQEITQFNKNVVMTFHYPADAALAAQDVSETLLVPVYYSTLVGNWILADSYVVDTVNNEITLHMNHFTTFGLMSTEAADNRMYLPLVLRD